MESRTLHASTLCFAKLAQTSLLLVAVVFLASLLLLLFCACFCFCEAPLPALPLPPGADAGNARDTKRTFSTFSANSTSKASFVVASCKHALLVNNRMHSIARIIHSTRKTSTPCSSLKVSAQSCHTFKQFALSLRKAILVSEDSVSEFASNVVDSFVFLYKRFEETETRGYSRSFSSSSFRKFTRKPPRLTDVIFILLAPKLFSFSKAIKNAAQHSNDVIFPSTSLLVSIFPPVDPFFALSSPESNNAALNRPKVSLGARLVTIALGAKSITAFNAFGASSLTLASTCVNAAPHLKIIESA
mmetsp:Transcript_4541/g.15637  ORF Transcript_4541/g.15637 Transcript_4541/m.15637 type:complete len:302 (-) Transcript_4541:683-1588(-)